MTISVNTLYGTFQEDDLKSISDALDEICLVLTAIDSKKQEIKDIVDATFDAHKIPKKVLNRLAKTRYKQSFESDVAEDNEFEAIYTGLAEVK